MKVRQAYFKVTGKVLYDLLANYPGTTNTLPKDAKYRGLIYRKGWLDEFGLVIESESFPDIKITNSDQIPELDPMPAWTKIE